VVCLTVQWPGSIDLMADGQHCCSRSHAAVTAASCNWYARQAASHRCEGVVNGFVCIRGCWGRWNELGQVWVMLLNLKSLFISQIVHQWYYIWYCSLLQCLVSSPNPRSGMYILASVCQPTSQARMNKHYQAINSTVINNSEN